MRYVTENSPATESIGLLYPAISYPDTWNISVLGNIADMLFLADTLNGDSEEFIWGNIDGRPPQLLFMLP